MIFIDAFVRFSGASLLLVLAFLSIRDMTSRHMRVIFLRLLILTVAASLLGYTPEGFSLPDPLQKAARFLDIPNLVFAWLFGLSLFDDKFLLRPTHAAIATLYCLPVIWLRLFQFGYVTTFPDFGLLVIDLIALAMMGHLIFVTLKGRADDLLEDRRRSRFNFVICIAAITSFYAIADLLHFTGMSNQVPTVKAAIMLPAITITLLWLTQIRPAAMEFPSASKPAFDNLKATDRLILAKLTQEMEVKKAYLETNLTIEKLAKRLGTTPHKLRFVINGTLGHRHFSAYLNAHRVEEVKLAFEDPLKAGVPILTLAFEAGFNSLSPFNRAFKEFVGLTPSQYRSQLGVN